MEKIARRQQRKQEKLIPTASGDELDSELAPVPDTDSDLAPSVPDTQAPTDVSVGP